MIWSRGSGYWHNGCFVVKRWVRFPPDLFFPANPFILFSLNENILAIFQENLVQKVVHFWAWLYVVLTIKKDLALSALSAVLPRLKTQFKQAQHGNTNAPPTWINISEVLFLASNSLQWEFQMREQIINDNKLCHAFVIRTWKELRYII